MEIIFKYKISQVETLRESQKIVVKAYVTYLGTCPSKVYVLLSQSSGSGEYTIPSTVVGIRPSRNKHYVIMCRGTGSDRATTDSFKCFEVGLYVQNDTLLYAIMPYPNSGRSNKRLRSCPHAILQTWAPAAKTSCSFHLSKCFWCQSNSLLLRSY